MVWEISKSKWRLPIYDFEWKSNSKNNGSNTFLSLEGKKKDIHGYLPFKKHFKNGSKLEGKGMCKRDLEVTIGAYINMK